MTRVKQVAIVGRDAAAWLSALALRRALGGAGIEVTVVELPSLLQPVDVFSAVPSLGALHRILGLREADILPRTGGVPVLGQRFAGWSGPGSEFVHGYDMQRPSIGDVDFLQFWVMAHAEGMHVPYEEFSIAAAAAKQGRVAPPDQDADALGGVALGYHLDALAYVALIRAAALQTGVVRHPAQQVSVEREGDRIAAVALEGGTRIEADLFVDASGAEALLLGGQPGIAWEDWRSWLPCDRLLAATAPRLNPLPCFPHIAAFQAGWLGMFPLQDRTAVLAAYDSDILSDEEMLRAATAVVGAQIGADALVSLLKPGAQKRPWIGNCVGVGEAVVGLEPLDGIQLHLIHLGISHLISLFPADAAEMPEAQSYNQVVVSHFRSVRDFQIVHYKRNARVGELLWDRVRNTEGPAGLDAKLALFAARGQVPLYDEETFEFQNWAAILIGHGLVPRDYAPVVDEVPREQAVAKFQSFLGLIAEEVRAMPTVEAYLRGGGASPPPQRRGLY
jgi:tryptophan halogenase